MKTYLIEDAGPPPETQRGDGTCDRIRALRPGQALAFPGAKSATKVSGSLAGASRGKGGLRDDCRYIWRLRADLDPPHVWLYCVLRDGAIDDLPLRTAGETERINGTNE